MNAPQVRIEDSWKQLLADEFIKEYFCTLTTNVRTEYLSSTVYPPPKQVFRAFDLCPVSDVSVVIIGQDPYHGHGQANGLSFAVDDGIKLPPSLKNILKEIESDLGIVPRASGDLSRWARQGVLMLNAVLTVRAGVPASHKGMGWEMFTDAVIMKLNEEKKHVVYMLWGKYAQEKGINIDRTNNLVLISGHPSPYSANLFHGNHHFSQCNSYLVKNGKKPIDWS